MTTGIILVSAVILLCIPANKFSKKFGMPVLILFMFMGMLFGSDGILKIPFDDFNAAQDVCSIALIFIMYYGGFNTKWEPAKSVAGKAVLLSTLGVIITAGITGLLCRWILGFSWIESFLAGAVLSSTDAASVFSILRQKKLNMKDGTASLLELESGSNDPMSYMLTAIAMGVLTAGTMENVLLRIFTQMFFGVTVGVLFAVVCVWILTKARLVADGLDTIFLIAMVLLCYAISDVTGGNQYLSVYLMGIIIGNNKIKNKAGIIAFFDGVTSLAQILIFFLLGLLAFPHEMPQIILPALAIAVSLTLVARPVAVFALLLPFKCSIKQCTLISWAGLRGAASSVFAIMVIASGADVSYDLFHIVFTVSLFSVAIQGTLLPWVAKKLDMVDEGADVRKTFNDYTEDSAMTLMRMYIPKGHNWENRKISEVNMPTGSLALMIKRNGESLITRGETVVLADDTVILSVPSYEPSAQEQLEEIHISKTHPWCGKRIAQLNLPPDELIAMVIRGEETIIPDGKTVIQENDIVVTYK